MNGPPHHSSLNCKYKSVAPRTSGFNSLFSFDMFPYTTLDRLCLCARSRINKKLGMIDGFVMITYIF